jgi:GNAT superfamily N-acetyltransferase
MAELVFDAVYSPLCDKLSYVRKVAKHYSAVLREYNMWEIDDDELERLPQYVHDKILELRQGRDGFYAWVVFANGKHLKDFESEYPFPMEEASETLQNKEEQTEVKNVAVRPITMKDIEEGLEGVGVTDDAGRSFCLACLTPSKMGEGDSRYVQTKRKDFYLYLIKVFGTFGFLATQNDAVLAFITFFPKAIARRIGYYTSTSDEHLDKTLIVGCLFVPKQLRGKGLATRLIRAVVDHAKENGYSKIEVTTIPKELGHGWEWWAKYPFEKLGFEMEQERYFDDGYRGKDWGMQIFSLNL